MLLRSELAGTDRSYNSPLTYAQISRKFGVPSFMCAISNVNSIAGDPLNHFIGRYSGPSIGIRKDISEYAALKLQYDLLGQPLGPSANGLLMQTAFTF